jgi:deazaflavin-dependent oxidoreductase (nitroreductase family)
MSWKKNARYSIQAYLQHGRMSNNGTTLLESAKKGEVMTFNLQDFAGEDYCHLTTTGRITGRPHTVEIWFALHNQTLYILSGGMDRSDWVKNALRYPGVSIKIRNSVFDGQARLVKDEEEDALARRLLFDKYSPRDGDLEEWARTSLPMAFDLVISP